jgi:hypothetical protein
MCMVMPFFNELVQLGAKLIFGCKIHHASAFALEDTAPLCHLIHPGAMHGREVHYQAWMMSQPLMDLFPMRRTDMVAHQMDRADTLLNLDIHCVQKGHEFPLPLAVLPVPVDLASTGVEGGKEMEGPRPLVLMLDAVGPGGGLGWQGRGRSGPRLQGGLLIEGEHQLIRSEGTDREVNQLGDGSREGGVPRVFGVQPQMLAPGLQLMGGQNPPHRGGRDVLHDPIGDALTRECGTIPLGEATTPQVRPLAGQAHDVDRDLRGKNRPWPRGQGRLKDRPDAGRENAWPSGGPRSVARQWPAPPRIGRPLLPARG